MVALYEPSGVKARYQAERLRADLRHAQMVALSQNAALRITAATGTGGSYSVFTIGGIGTGECTTTALTDPATGQAFAVTVDATLTLGGTASIDLDQVGRPASCSGNPCSCTVSASDPAASYTLTAGSTVSTVQLKPVTGFVTVSP